MSINRTDYSIKYDITAPNQTQFPFNFSSGSVDDIHVFDLDAAAAVEVPRARFNVTPSPLPAGLDNGGSVTLGVPLVVGHKIEIRRITVKSQELRLDNQAQLQIKSIERAFDKLTRIDQEQGGMIASLEVGASGLASQVADLYTIKADKTALAAETAARIAANNTEASTRAAADTALQNRASALEQGKADKTALAAETAARIAANNTLQTEIAKNASAITQLDTGKMSAAPNDGRHYVAVGKDWLSLENGVGNPFVLNAKDYAIAKVFLAYLPNKIWDILPDRRVLSRASRPGDSDGVFAITEDGRFAVRVGPPFVRAADGRALVSKRPAYLPNKIWSIGCNRLTRSRASRPGDSDGVFVIDAGGRAVRVR